MLGDQRKCNEFSSCDESWILTFKEIGIKIMNGASDKGAEIAYHAALDQLAVQLIEDGTCRTVDLVLKNPEQAEIRKLADWDTTKSHKYAWKVISFIALKGNTMLPEKKRIILWDKNIGQRKKIVRLKDGSVIYIPLHR